MTKAQLLVLLLFGIVTALTLLAVAGQTRLDGPLLLVLGDGHGVHLGDLIPATFWLSGVAICLRLAQHLD